jgi:hypothetical protein
MEDFHEVRIVRKARFSQMLRSMDNYYAVARAEYKAELDWCEAHVPVSFFIPKFEQVATTSMTIIGLFEFENASHAVEFRLRFS